MKVVVLREFLNGNQVVQAGRKIVVGERRGEALIKNGLVAQDRSELGIGDVRTRRAARPAGTATPTAAAAKSATAAPSTSRRTGGSTGETKQPSSSRPARQRSTHRYSRAETKPASSQ